MNVLPTFVLLAILTLIAYRHVHAYRIAKRRRGGSGRTSNRQSTTESSHIPPCDPKSCCGQSSCLKCMLQDKRCLTQDQNQQVTGKRAPLLPESSWPFSRLSSKTTQQSPYGLTPSSPFYDKEPRQLRVKQELMEPSYFGRYLFRLNQRPPTQNDAGFPETSGPVISPQGAPDIVRSKRTRSQVCPSSQEWTAVAVAINPANQLLEMIQWNERKEWVLEERCSSSRSPVLNNVACVERSRPVPMLIQHANGDTEEIFLEVKCCVAMQIY